MDYRHKITDFLHLGSYSGVAAPVTLGTLAPVTLRAAGNAPLILAIVPTAEAAARLSADLDFFAAMLNRPDESILLPEPSEADFAVRRNPILYNLLNGTSPRFLIAAVQSACAPAPSRAELEKCDFLLSPGKCPSFGHLLETLVAMDYDDEYEVRIPGEFARRGGIIDLFSPVEKYPVRLEFWGEELESMRSFDPETQRSTGTVKSYRVTGKGTVSSIANAMAETSSLLDYALTAGANIIVYNFAECLELLKKKGTDLQLFSELPENAADRLSLLSDGAAPGKKHCIPPGCFPAFAHFEKLLSDEAMTRGALELIRRQTASQLRQWIEGGAQITILSAHAANPAHIYEYFKHYELDRTALTVEEGDIPCGLYFPDCRFVLLAERELSGADLFRKSVPHALPAARTESLRSADPDAELDIGDYVVHIDHGIGIFRGVTTLDTRGVKREVIAIEYADQALLYVPVYQANLVTRYIGSAGKAVLHRLNGTKWKRDRAGTVKAVRDYAADLLRMQAVRQTVPALKLPSPDAEFEEFLRAFRFSDTPDQTRATAEILRDLSGDHPMDRLLCGDVGYGKTEVAMRAAYHLVAHGYQVAVLVPTTVLAQQHFYSFRERFAEYPYTVEMLSRFRTGEEQREILRKLATGGIDILIGTHRLCQTDVVFSNLGLVIVDEEQRFGVKHKEFIRRLRSCVHVLTMSATPIPRTLYMAMAGARDLSTIMTAPTRRVPVRTIMVPEGSPEALDAIRREVARNGQVFYLHNRVRSIEEAAKSLQNALPEVSFAVGHGQMDEHELEKIMADFIAGRIDVLVSTTIIESGLDVPNANTIIIERADRFGLAELYQLRGRVGRWTTQAYAYLLTPPPAVISSDGRKRLAAIRRYSQLGAGLQVALRDLEIRGAGNLLGAEQSGHINAVGFELYCQLLKQQVALLKGEKVDFLPEVDLSIDFLRFAYQAPPAYLAAALPRDYIPSERLRMDSYRKLASMTTPERVDAYAEELRDRYGELPEVAQNLLAVTKLRIAAAQAKFRSVVCVEGVVSLVGPTGSLYRTKGKLPRVDNTLPGRKKIMILISIVTEAGTEHTSGLKGKR